MTDVSTRVRVQHGWAVKGGGHSQARTGRTEDLNITGNVLLWRQRSTVVGSRMC